MRTFFCLLVAGFIFCQEVYAQELDTQYWHETVIRKNFNEKIGVFLKAEQWFFDEVGRLALYNFAPGVLFRPSNFLDFEFNYRYQTLKETKTRNHEHRIEIVPILKYQLEKFKISLRNRLELRNVDGDHSLRLRERLKIKRNVDLMGMDIALFASNEIFYNSNPDDFDQNRAKFGFSKAIQPNMSVDIYYMYFRQERQSGWFTANVLGTFMSVTF